MGLTGIIWDHRGQVSFVCLLLYLLNIKFINKLMLNLFLCIELKLQYQTDKTNLGHAWPLIVLSENMKLFDYGIILGPRRPIRAIHGPCYFCLPGFENIINIENASIASSPKNTYCNFHLILHLIFNRK